MLSRTSAITLVVPPNLVGTITSFINKELSTASNVKDKNNRKSIISALKKVREFFKSTKPNQYPKGVAVFAREHV